MKLEPESMPVASARWEVLFPCVGPEHVASRFPCPVLRAQPNVILASLSDPSEVSFPLVMISVVVWLSMDSDSEVWVCASCSMMWIGDVCSFTCVRISRSHSGRERMYALKEVKGLIEGFGGK
jgi:hypothetical protein